MAKAIDFYKCKLQTETRKEGHNPKKADMLRRKAQEMMLAVGQMRDALITMRRDIKDEFFKVKIQKSAEILKMRISEELKNKKIAEQNCDRLKKELTFFQTPMPDFNSNALPNSMSFRGQLSEKEKNMSLTNRLGMLQTDEFDAEKLGLKKDHDSIGGNANLRGSYHLSPISLHPIPPSEHSSCKDSKSASTHSGLSTPVRLPLSQLPSSSNLLLQKDPTKTLVKAQTHASSRVDLDKENLDLKLIEKESQEITKRIEKLRGAAIASHRSSDSMNMQFTGTFK